MAYYTHTNNPVGMFVEKDTDNHFEFSINEDKGFEQYPHKVWVGDTIGWPYRYATVKKTVAYIAVDEDENGPVIEKWYLKKVKDYVS